MIKIINARTNNLKNINLEIPKNCINVITGVSGSGKTSLAFDTIFVEGQRKYFELLSYSIKGNLPKYPKADVDTITGLTPVCSLKKSTRVNSNSTVGTLSEIIHYLRLMFARIGSVFCPEHNIKLERKSLTDIYNNLKKNYTYVDLIGGTQKAGLNKTNFSPIRDDLSHKIFVDMVKQFSPNCDQFAKLNKSDVVDTENINKKPNISPSKHAVVYAEDMGYEHAIQDLMNNIEKDFDKKNPGVMKS